MRVAALYDIHGNLSALEAVLDEIESEGVDRIVVGGDVIPGPMPVETLAALEALPCPVDWIYGNGERDVLAEMNGAETRFPEAFRETMRWNGERLGRERRRRLAEWPATLTLDLDGIGEVLFCHSTPRDDAEIFTERTPEGVLLPIFEEAGVGIVVCGHTHMQFERRIGTTRVVNAGSVGMPFDASGAYWLLLGPGIEFRRTDYDLAAAAARIRATAYPGADQFAENNVLEPPSRDEMLDVLEAGALSER